MNVADAINRLDLPFLAGIYSVLGFDDDGTTLRIVELQKHANVFNRHKPKFSVEHYFSNTFLPSASRSERAEIVKKLLYDHAITAKHVVSSIQTAGLKIIETPLPPDVENIDAWDAWIEEHYERLIRLPIAFKDIRYGYEVRKDFVEIAFVRKSDIDDHLAFVRELGLEVIGLGVGVFDVLNTQALLHPSYNTTTALQYHISKDLIHCFQIESGAIQKHTMMPISDIGEIGSMHSKEIDSNSPARQSVSIGGDVPPDYVPSGAGLLKPLSLPSEYTFAIGLALRGLGVSLTNFDVLDTASKKKHETSIYKSLMQRIVIIGGAVILLLLLLPVAANIFFQSKIDALEEQRLSDPLYAQAAALESQVKTLERQNTERQSVQQHAQISRLMYTIGKVMPAKVWLYKLSMEKNRKNIQLTLRGYSNDPEQIMDFLKRLETERCSPRLIRSGSALPAEAASIPKNGSFTTFEIKATAEE